MAVYLFLLVGLQRFWQMFVSLVDSTLAPFCVDLQKAGYICCSAQIKSHRRTHSHSQEIKHTQFGQSSSYHKRIIAN